MHLQAGMAVALREAPEGVRLLDLSCGRCAECLAGASLWCLDSRDEGPDLVSGLPLEAADVILGALLAAASLLEAPEGTAVLVAEPTGSPLAVLAERLRDGRPVVVGDPNDVSVREGLAELDATGRAPLVVTSGDARGAVKAVRRGGSVCLPAASGEQPTLTELVQREVTLIGPRSLSRLLDALPQQGLQAAIDAV